MDKKFNITPDEEALYTRNREMTPYVRTFEEDGISYPIPDLIGSSRLIAIDEDTVGAKEITLATVNLHQAHQYISLTSILIVRRLCIF